MNKAKYDASIAIINQAVNFLNTSNKSPKILIKIANNMGDSLHGQPIIRHYRTVHPNACIVYLTEQRYHNVHQYDKNIDKLFALPNGLDGKTRLQLWRPIKENKSIDISVIPAINPFRSWYKQNDWSLPNIADQYFHNAGIPNHQPAGGRELIIKTDDRDKLFAKSKLNGIDRPKLIALEYISYSCPPKWKATQYASFVQLAKQRGYTCVSIAGNNEKAIAGTINLCGSTWRQATAALANIGTIIGCGSGVTMLAAASRPQPKIIELGVPHNVTINGCGYAKSIQVTDLNPASVLKLV